MELASLDVCQSKVGEEFFAHFALTDIERGEFHAFERFARGALGLAGARSDPFEIRVENWSARGSGDRMLPLRLQARQDGIAVDLVLERGKPVVLQGEAGLSQKSAESGNASYYYSYTRLPVSGFVRLGDDSNPVRGEAWFDHEWSTSALGEDQVGWDWFALQLDNGCELMLYRMRRTDGSMDPFSSGSLVLADGRSIPIGADDMRIQVDSHWSSADGNARYPSAFSLQVPSHEIDLRVTTPVPDQELTLAVRYWEGLVDVTGRHGGAEVQGRGYVEMTGYAGRR